MNIGIPNEISAEERRIVLTPVGVYALTSEGHTVFVEKGAGLSSGFSDTEFQEVGANTVFSSEEVFQRSDLIAKIQAPTEAECQYLDFDKTVFSFLGLGTTSRAMIDALLQKRVTAFGYEFGEQPDGTLPILIAMSEIAGLLLPQIAGRFLESEKGGRGITLAGIAGVPPANVVLLGAGAVGLNAARAFAAAGAQVLVMDRDISKLRKLDGILQKRVSTSIVTPLLTERAVRFADVLVGAVLIHGKRTPHLVSKGLVAEMKAGSVILDVSIDQGGCIETSRPTSLSSPIFFQDGVIHYCVPNIPASVARTASHALNNSILRWILEVARHGMVETLRKYACIRNGTYLFRGQSTLKSLSDLYNLEYQDLDMYLKHL